MEQIKIENITDTMNINIIDSSIFYYITRSVLGRSRKIDSDT